MRNSGKCYHFTICSSAAWPVDVFVGQGQSVRGVPEVKGLDLWTRLIKQHRPVVTPTGQFLLPDVSTVKWAIRPSQDESKGVLVYTQRKRYCALIVFVLLYFFYSISFCFICCWPLHTELMCSCSACNYVLSGKYPVAPSLVMGLVCYCHKLSPMLKVTQGLICQKGDRGRKSKEIL